MDPLDPSLHDYLFRGMWESFTYFGSIYAVVAVAGYGCRWAGIAFGDDRF